jgi:mannose-6-phosphate isomerase-like protein (cupin superfamily)
MLAVFLKPSFATYYALDHAMMAQDVSGISTAEHYTWGGVCDGWHLLKDPALSVIQERVPPSAGEAPHFHVSARQFFYVLSGVATMEFEDRTVTFGPNQGLHVAPNTPHRFVNHSDVDVVFLVISSPTTAGDRINVPAWV